jgi:hypothetical protein
VDGENAALVAGEQIVDKIANDRVRFVPELGHHAANQDAGATVPFQVDDAMRFAAPNFRPSVGAAWSQMFDGIEMKFRELTWIAHDFVPERAAAGRHYLNHRLHSLGENRPSSMLSQLAAFWSRRPGGDAVKREH